MKKGIQKGLINTLQGRKNYANPWTVDAAVKYKKLLFNDLFDFFIFFFIYLFFKIDILIIIYYIL